MRYKIKANSLEAFFKAKALVEPHTRIWVASERRRLLSTGDLPECLQIKLAALGAEVYPDIQYQADAA